jgi:prepilin-type N-terminal cleavage/methylation domain-containing protein
MSARTNRFTGGFTMVELLLALAITGLLLAAVATAFNASVTNYRQNQDTFKAVNNARQALSQMIERLRTATAVEPSALTDRCSLITADGNDITYKYIAGSNRLELVTNDDLTDSDYLLCDNITAMTFQKSTAVKDSLTYVTGVQISMTVTSGDIEKAFSAAAVIRRNMN